MNVMFNKKCIMLLHNLYIKFNLFLAYLLHFPLYTTEKAVILYNFYSSDIFFYKLLKIMSVLKQS